MRTRNIIKTTLLILVFASIVGIAAGVGMTLFMNQGLGISLLALSVLGCIIFLGILMIGYLEDVWD